MELEQDEPITLAHSPLMAPHKGQRYGEANNFLEEQKKHGSFEGLGSLLESLGGGGGRGGEEKGDHKAEAKGMHVYVCMCIF
ncbi:hypothetical protein EON65_43050, partial [archaeon]